MTDGALNDVDAVGQNMRNDVVMVLMEITRDQPDCGLTVDHKRLDQIAALISKKLQPRIGGRYIPKAEHREMERRVRNARIIEFFKGKPRVAKNYEECRVLFNVSRRLIANILAESNKRKTVQRF